MIKKMLQKGLENCISNDKRTRRVRINIEQRPMNCILRQSAVGLVKLRGSVDESNYELKNS